MPALPRVSDLTSISEALRIRSSARSTFPSSACKGGSGSVTVAQLIDHFEMAEKEKTGSANRSRSKGKAKLLRSHGGRAVPTSAGSAPSEAAAVPVPTAARTEGDEKEESAQRPLGGNGEEDEQFYEDVTPGTKMDCDDESDSSLELPEA